MPIMQRVTLDIRNDAAGSGFYGAPRGNRTHRGVDYTCQPGGAIYSPITGTVSKLGYPYMNDLDWRYVQVTASDGLHHRVFYVKPGVSVGALITPWDTIGLAQDITQRYPNQGMTPHIHYEIMDDSGVYYDPLG